MAGWPLADLAIALAIPADRVSAAGESLAFIVFGMILGVTLWALIALSSLPLFFAIRPWIDRFVCKVTRWRGAALAAAGVTPLVLIVVVLRLALRQRETSFRAISTNEWFVSAVLCVALGLGTFAAAEMWRVVFQPHQDTRWSNSNESIDITSAVRVKEDLEVLRIMLANAAMGFLSLFLLLILPLAVLGLLVMIFERPDGPGTVPWVSLVPSAVIVAVILPMIVLTSYQIGLWHFVSVRASGVCSSLEHV